jgi:hypothetical protein
MKMPLVPCPDCGNECSPLAVSCPKCGRPFSEVELAQSAHASTIQNDLTNAEKLIPGDKVKTSLEKKEVSHEDAKARLERRRKEIGNTGWIKKFESLKPRAGKTRKQIEAVIGSPTSVSISGNGKTLCKWEAKGFHFTLGFNGGSADAICIEEPKGLSGSALLTIILGILLLVIFAKCQSHIGETQRGLDRIEERREQHWQEGAN